MDLNSMLMRLNEGDLQALMIISVLAFTGIVITLSITLIVNLRVYREKKLAGALVRSMLEQNRDAAEIETVLRIWMQAGQDPEEVAKLIQQRPLVQSNPVLNTPPAKSPLGKSPGAQSAGARPPAAKSPA